MGVSLCSWVALFSWPEAQFGCGMLAVSFLSICWAIIPFDRVSAWGGGGRWYPIMGPHGISSPHPPLETEMEAVAAPTPGIHVTGRCLRAHTMRKKLLRQSHRPPHGPPNNGACLIQAQVSSLYLPQL